jgi:hypothetical protein
MPKPKTSKSKKRKSEKDSFTLDGKTLFVIIGSLLVFLLMTYFGIRGAKQKNLTPLSRDNVTNSKPSSP